MTKKEYINYLNRNDYTSILVKSFYHESKGLLSRLSPNEIINNINLMAFKKAESVGFSISPNQFVDDLIKGLVIKWNNQFSLCKLTDKQNVLIKMW